MRKRLGSTLVGVTIVASVMGLVPARAATTYVCSLTGKTTSLTPIPAPPKTGGGGTFSFSGTATCLKGAARQVVGVSANGTYTNLVCGTGTANGVATFTGGPSPISFKVNFVLGVGSLTVNGGGKGSGVVDIVPANATGCITKPVTGFTIRAVTEIQQ